MENYHVNEMGWDEVSHHWWDINSGEECWMKVKDMQLNRSVRALDFGGNSLSRHGISGSTSICAMQSELLNCPRLL
jgi:hypothetical protein